MTRPTPQRRLSMPKLTRRLTNIVIHDDDIEHVPVSTVPSTPSHEMLEDEYLDQWTKAIEQLEQDHQKQSSTAAQPNDIESLQASIAYHMNSTLHRTQHNLEKVAVYQAVAFSLRDKVLKQWNQTQQLYKKEYRRKRCYYLSMEFLLGRALDNALYALHVKDNYGEAVHSLGFSMEDLLEQERDAALGNGGLGRLAACYMDAAASVDLPCWGYGLRYNNGLFRQGFDLHGQQTESPDDWLKSTNPWEFPRDIHYQVQFYGYVATKVSGGGDSRLSWETNGAGVEAWAYDVPVPGYHGACGNLRLWASKATQPFDLQAFNDGDYGRAMAAHNEAACLTAVLYPNDNHPAGKELRLKQEYFYVSASVQDVVHRFKRTAHVAWSEFPNRVAMQLNDTHPSLAIVELQRILVDIEGLPWDDAWAIVRATFGFTNHTVLPEAHECWPVPLMEKVLPRHMQLIYDLNLFFLQDVERRFPGDRDLLNKVSIIEESNPQQVRMAYLSVVGSHTCNGVAALHSDLVKTDLFPHFIKYYGPERFINITNGITPRRWLYQANPALRDLITATLTNDHWVSDLSQLAGLKQYAEDEQFQKKWMAVKLQNKQRLANWIATHLGIDVSPRALFDIQVKRIHEYKRQFLNILGVIHRYRTLLEMGSHERAQVVPRVVIFGGKAAPGYHVAKMVIKLITSVAKVINDDLSLDDLLKVVYIPDYKVSLAEIIIPASDLSQHISTAGTEASGTSNMKFVLNGGLILGTVDGANIEIRDEIGEDNIFMFGTLADQVADIRHYQKYHGVLVDGHLQTVIESIQAGDFGDPASFNPLIDTLTYGGDYYLISEDFDSYLKRQDDVDADFKNKRLWAKKSILCTAGMGFFSSDRAIREYADKIWKIDPLPISS